MSFGVTPEGFNKKRLSDIAEESTEAYQSKFGPQINLDPEDSMGQVKGIEDERIALIWELAEATYNSQYPSTAEGASLDNVLTLTGDEREGATSSTVTGRVFGTLGSPVPLGFVASVQGSPTSTFESITTGNVGPGIDEVQEIGFSGVPTSGEFKLRYNGTEDTAAILFSDNAATVQTQLNGLASLSAVTVSGDFTIGFTVTFTGADGEKEQPLLETFDNTLDDGTPVIIVIVETIKGYEPFVDIDFIAQNTGPVSAPSSSLTVIETPEPGITGITNLLDAVIGESLESDADAKIRRDEELQRSGSATIEGIRNELLDNVENVTQAIVVENATDVIDSGGRPPHSFESFVLGGLDAEIAQAIFKSKAAGIQTFGTITESVTDSQGITYDIKFSRPNEISIWLIVNIVPNTNTNEGPLYPVTGDQLVDDAILEFVKDFTIGQDVINSQLYIPINTVPGVIGIELLQGIAPAPTLEDNIPIDFTEIAKFDSSRIIVNS